MRYCQKDSVERVQKYLTTLGVMCHVSALHNFIRRMLTEFPSGLADAHRVDLRLLKAVRRRLKLPLHPVRRRDTSKRALPRFACVSALAAVRPRGPARRRPVEKGQADNRQIFPCRTTPPTMVPAHAQVEVDVAGREPTAPQWQAISRQALIKLPDHVCPWEDQVIDTRTREPISEASLVADYGLSPHEAKAIFLNP